MMACFCLHGARTEASDGFRFRDTQQHSIKGVLGQKTDVNQWDHYVFPAEGLKAVCCHSNGEILLTWDLRPSNLEIWVDKSRVWPEMANQGSSLDSLKKVILKLAGVEVGQRYIDQHFRESANSEAPISEGTPPMTESSEASPNSSHLDDFASGVNCAANELASSQAASAQPKSDHDAATLEGVVDLEIERCIVAVSVNGVVCGTGFVIGEGIAVTCAHVVLPEDKTPTELVSSPQYAITFLALLPKTRPQVVQLDFTHFSRKSQNDVAFLTWNGGLPPGVSVGKLSANPQLTGRVGRIKGFATQHPYQCLPLEVRVVGTAIKHGAYPVWTLESANSLLRGHSGAPLLDTSSAEILGMASATSLGESAHSQDARYGFVVKCETIIATGPKYFEHRWQTELDDRLAQAAKDLLHSLRDILLRSPSAQGLIAEEFGCPDLIPAERLKAEELAKQIVSVAPQKSVEQLMRVEAQLRNRPKPDVDGAAVVADLYLAFLPALINRHGHDDVRLLLKNVVGLSSGPVIMPFSSRTILALYLAAIDGTPVKLSRRAAQGLEVPGDHIFPEIPEAGFQNGSVNQSTVLQHIVQQMGGLPEGFLNWTAEDQLLEAQDRLRRSHLTLKNTKGLVLSRQLTLNQEEALREILSYVAIVYLTTKRSEHQHLISPFSLGSLLPPPPPPDRPE